jgi:regulator of protease activity HflC (stomatin/prohibitin superfamily)
LLPDQSGALTIWLIDLFGFAGFALAVLIGMLPGFIALVIALALAADFVRGMYELRDWRTGLGYMIRVLLGQWGFPPYLVIKEGKITGPPGHALRRVGGPGNLIIYSDTAIVTEQSGRLKRVLGPGFPRLERFEKIWEVIDLRPKRWVYDVSAMTKEGIPVTVPADVRFKIEDGGQEPTDKKPYPMLEEAVFAAATSKWMREPDKSEPDRALDWAGRAIIGDTEGTLRTIISGYYLDQLIMPVRCYIGYLRQAIWKELEEKLKPYDADWTANLAGKSERYSPQAIRAELDKNLKHYLDQLGGEAGEEHNDQATRQKIDAILNYYLDRLIWPQRDSQGRPRQVTWEEMEEKLNHYLDQLAGPEEEEGGWLPRQAIAEKLEEELKKSVSGLGAKILGVTLGEIRLEDEVFNQWLENWRAEWESWAEGLEAEGEAQRELTLEATGAGVQRKLVTDITRAFEEMESKGMVFGPELIALRLIKVLEGAYFDPRTRGYFPEQAMQSLADLRELSARLPAGERGKIPPPQDEIDLFENFNDHPDAGS